MGILSQLNNLRIRVDGPFQEIRTNFSLQAVKPSYWRPGLTVRPDTNITKGDGSNNDNGKRSYSSVSTILAHLIKPGTASRYALLTPFAQRSFSLYEPHSQFSYRVCLCRALSSSFFFAPKKSVINERELRQFQLQRLQ